MATNDFLDLEVTYTKIGLVTVLATILWLYPKYFKVPIVWEIASGLCATSMVLTAAASSSRIEKRKRYERAEKAAQEDLFTMELAHTVFAQQQQFEHQFHPAAPVAVAQVHPAFGSAMPLANAPNVAQPEPLPQATAPHPPEHELLHLDELTNYPSIIIYGPQGSGKTTLANAIAQHRTQQGHTVEVLDPHGSPWPFPVVGNGMNYEAIALKIVELLETLKSRYEAFGAGDRAFHPYTLVCDEFTNWSQRLDSKLVLEFLRTCWTDIRKVEMMAIFISHANTLEGGLAGAKGLSVLRDNGCVQIELFAEIDPVSRRARPTGYGQLYRPGMAPVTVKIPNATNTPTNTLEPYQQKGLQPITNAGANVQGPTVQGPFSWVPVNVREQLMMAIASGHPKAASINQLLGISKGGSSAWQKASTDWDHLKGMI